MAADLAGLLAEELWAAGTRFAFGVPGGGSNLDVVGAVVERGMRFVLVHGETAAGIMAATCGELTGHPGLCIVTRGPGAASAVNGVVHARLDRDPMVLVTDDVAESARSRVSHQRIDQHALFGPITKSTSRLGHGSARETIRAAIAAAVTPPWGPSHLTLDPSAASGPVEIPGGPDPLSPVPGGASSEPDHPTGIDSGRALVDSARALIGSAHRPVVLVGTGARFDAPAVRQFVDRSHVPAFTTYKARGIVADSSPRSAGTITGGSMERPLIDRADLIITIGLDPVELIPAPWGYRAPVLSIGPWVPDSDYFTPTLEIIGPIGWSLAALTGEFRDEWDDDTAVRHRQASRSMLAVPVEGLAPHDLVRLVREAAPDDAIATIDAGAHMLVAVEFWSVDEPGHLLISNGSATMGYALPAAIAASLVHPDRPVVCFVGDGGLGMVTAELETVARLGLNVKVVVFNDSTLSLIAIKQRDGHGGNEAVRFTPTDFAAVARGHGIPAQRVDNAHDLDRADSTIFSQPGPVLLDARIDASGYKQTMAALRGKTSF